MWLFVNTCLIKWNVMQFQRIISINHTIIWNITIIIISLWTNGLSVTLLMMFPLFKCLTSPPTITHRVYGLLAITIFGRLYWINDDLPRLILKRCSLYLSSIREIRLSCRRESWVREERNKYVEVEGSAADS